MTRFRQPTAAHEPFEKVTEQGAPAIRPIAFWVWNDRLDPVLVRNTIRAFSMAGFGGSLIQSGSGVPCKSTDEEWLDALEAAVDEARNHHQSIWLGEDFGMNGALDADGSGFEQEIVMRRLNTLYREFGDEFGKTIVGLRFLQADFSTHSGSGSPDAAHEAMLADWCRHREIHCLKRTDAQANAASEISTGYHSPMGVGESTVEKSTERTVLVGVASPMAETDGPSFVEIWQGEAASAAWLAAGQAAARGIGSFCLGPFPYSLRGARKRSHSWARPVTVENAAEHRRLTDSLTRLSFLLSSSTFATASAVRLPGSGVVPERVIVDGVNGSHSIETGHWDSGRWQYLVIANSGESPAEISASFHDDGAVEEWNCETGTIRSLAPRQDGSVSPIVPGPGLVVVALDTASSDIAIVPRMERKTKERVNVPGPWRLHLKGRSLLPLDRCAFKVDSGPWQPEADIEYVRTILASAHSIPVTVNGTTLTLTSETPVPASSCPRRGDRSCMLRFLFDIVDETCKSDLSLILEEREQWEVLVNGSPLPENDGGFWIDRSLRSFTISRLVRKGRNVLLLAGSLPEQILLSEQPGTSPSDLFATIEAPILAGRFSVRCAPISIADADQELPPGTGGFTLAKIPETMVSPNPELVGLKNWDGTVHMEAKITLPRHSGKSLIFSWERPCTEEVKVLFNGRNAGVRQWAPYELNITHLARNGRNRIELVALPPPAGMVSPQRGDIGSPYLTFTTR